MIINNTISSIAHLLYYGHFGTLSLRFVEVEASMFVAGGRAIARKRCAKQMT